MLRNVRKWDRLVSGCVIEEFRHREIVCTTEAPPPPAEELETLFERPHKRRKVCEELPAEEKELLEKRNKFLESVEAIKDESRFKAFTPESEQKLVSELQFLRILNQGNLWHMADGAWVTALLPRRQLVHFKMPSLFVFVLKPYEYAAMCWPAQRVEGDVWQGSKKRREVTWHSLFSIDDVGVLPLQSVSPLHMCLKAPLYQLR